MASTNSKNQTATETKTWTPPVMPERFKKIETQRFMYSPQKCFGFPVIGYAIGKEQMPPIQVGKDPHDGSPIFRDWSAIIIRLTQDTKATDRNKEVIDVKVGQEVAVPCTWQLENFLSSAASHPSRVFEIYISPKEEINTKAGQTMWDYELGVSPESKSLDEFGLISKLGEKKIGQLSDGRQFDKETGEVA